MKKILVVAIVLGACGGDAPRDEAVTPESGRGAVVQPAPSGSEAGAAAAPDSGAAVDGVAGGALPVGAGAQPSGPQAASADEPVSSPATEDAAPAAGDEGAQILRRASAAYADVRSLQADFVMSFTNPLTRQTGTSRGTLYQRRPDRIALRFSEPAGDLLVSDGTHFYQYYPSVDAKQATRFAAGASDQDRIDLQAQFLGNPVERFSWTLHGTENVSGRSTSVLTLVPRADAEYRSLKVWIDTRDHLARRFEITERNGVVRRFDLSNMQTNTNIADAVFRFTPPDGVRVINAG